MAGFVPSAARTAELHRRMIDGLAERLATVERRLRNDPAERLPGSGPGGALWSEMASAEAWAFVEITGRTGSGQYTAKRKMFDAGTGALADDDELTDVLTVWSVGKAAFSGAIGFARWCGWYGAPASPTDRWLMASGEWDGIYATISGAHDASFTYPWTQVETPAWRTPLSSATKGRAKDLSSGGYDPDTDDAADRVTLANGTLVFLRWSAITNQFVFERGVEALTEVC